MHGYYFYCVMQDNDEKLGNERLMKMARGVAQGMDYLSTIGFVHRVIVLGSILARPDVLTYACHVLIHNAISYY